MLLPLLEYNKHIAKIPNCKMRSSLRACNMMLLLLLLLLLGHSSDIAQALDTAANNNSSSNAGGASNSAAAAAAGAASGGGGGGIAGLATGVALPAAGNLTELGSPVFRQFECATCNMRVLALGPS
ncbi:uncharacterized protein LOC108608182 isoform X2 [Drosophila busckii]|uniref:uncharacterized protein LOC108608182 isoform X2 n=1 Tax=Drosophila busckii TaxID=30019 RepID=UPI0014332754|nr:uncharacterized protein LOC108608182 isoform X2 [Drosophila busckii]